MLRETYYLGTYLQKSNPIEQKTEENLYKLLKKQTGLIYSQWFAAKVPRRNHEGGRGHQSPRPQKNNLTTMIFHLLVVLGDIK